MEMVGRLLEKPECQRMGAQMPGAMGVAPGGCGYFLIRGMFVFVFSLPERKHNLAF